MNKFSMWCWARFGGSSQNSQEPERTAAAGNRFSALQERNFQRSPWRDDTAGREMRKGATAGHGRGKINTRSSQEGDRREPFGAASNRYMASGRRSQNSSRYNSWNRDDRRQPPSMGPRGSRKIKEMSEDEMDSKAKNILEEYLNIKDLAEAKLCVSELAGQPLLYLVVTGSVNDVLERNDQAREITGQYLHELVQNRIISLEEYMKGMNEVLQYAEDMVIDIPMLWDYLAQVMTPLLVGGSLPWARISTMLKPALSQPCALTLLTKLVQHTKGLSSEDEVSRQWQDSGLNWSQFVESSKVEAHLRDHKLEFTVRPSGGGGADLSRVSNQLEALVLGSEEIEEMEKSKMLKNF